MPYVLREDGERFIIPSYRDVLSAKKKSLLKREILLLTANYGEYITLQKKNAQQYEVAFSPEPGALLGETIWYYFKKPQDLIYCEVIPNTTDAILVIVKSGSVYLDGTFAIDSIPEELVVFKTQQNNFNIYLYGDLPISQTPVEGKFYFDPSSVKSFVQLDKPIFPTLPLIRSLQLQLVSVVLKAHGIGVLPVKNILFTLVVLGLGWMGWNYISSHKQATPEQFVETANPYEGYIVNLSSPAPMEQIQQLVNKITLLFTMPGWYPESLTYTPGTLQVDVKSGGSRTDSLFTWAKANKAEVQINASGFSLVINLPVVNRPPPQKIFYFNDVIGNLIDRVSYVTPGNTLTVGNLQKRGIYSEADVTITFSDISPTTLSLLGLQLKELPLTLKQVTISVDEGNLTGTILLKALGN